jgi:hypothetical protein
MNAVSATTAIRKLTIQRFRGLKKLDWRPESDVKGILGGRDEFIGAVAVKIWPLAFAGPAVRGHLPWLISLMVRCRYRTFCSQS